MTTTAALERLNEADFRVLQAWARSQASLVLTDAQRVVAEKRLHPLLWKHKVATFHELCGYLTRGILPQLQADALEALSANNTRFFRDPAAFDYLRENVLPGLIAARGESRELKVWSAGCSTGQEAYSLAMLLGSMPELEGWSISLLATDVSKRQIDRARQGIYTRDEVNQGLPMQLLLEHFQQDGIVWTARPELKERVQFQVLRLDQAWDGLPLFDLILLRNVLPSMEEEKRQDLLHAAYGQLASDGCLMLGNHEKNELSASDSEADAFFNCYRRGEMAETPEAA